MNFFTCVFQRFYLDFKNIILSPQAPHVLTQAPHPHQILNGPPYSQQLWETLGLVKTESDFIARSVETGLGR